MTSLSRAGTAVQFRFWEASAVVWTAVVLSLAITPIRNVAMITASISDKILHASAFLVGSIVWAGVLGNSENPFRSAGFAGVICLGMGGLIELLQTQTSTRQAETGDIVADTVGICIGAVLWILLSMRNQRLNSSQNSAEANIGF